MTSFPGALNSGEEFLSHLCVSLLPSVSLQTPSLGQGPCLRSCAARSLIGTVSALDGVFSYSCTLGVGNTLNLHLTEMTAVIRSKQVLASLRMAELKVLCIKRGVQAPVTRMVIETDRGLRQ